MNLRFSGKQALVVGGSCELALRLSRGMIHAGLCPTLTYRNDTGLHAILERLQDCDGTYSTAYLNFADRDSLRTLFDLHVPALDYLVDFVQGDFESLIASGEEDDIYNYFSENIAFRAVLIKRAARLMLAKRKGRFVFISSSAAIKPNPGQGFYAAAKTASEALYRNLGIELAGRGITTVTLRTGYVDEGRGKKYLKHHDRTALEKVPIKRALTAKEISEAILFHLSDGATGFNATEINLDGGLTAGK